MSESMDEFASMCEAIASHASRTKKVSLLARFLQSLTDEEFFFAVQFLSTGPVLDATPAPALFAKSEPAKLSVGSATLRDALLTVAPWDIETIRACHAEVGDTGELIGLLIRGNSQQRPMSIARASDIYRELFLARTTAQKRGILAQVFTTYAPGTVKYFVKV